MMNSRRTEINSLAESVRTACQLTIPVDVELAVARLGGQIVSEASVDYEAKIEKKGNGFLISLSVDSDENRKKFSVAHELGHLFLHMGYLVDDDKWKSIENYTDSVYYRYGYSVEEYEANEFAAALLMPASEFRKIAEKHREGNSYKVQQIAHELHVSAEAVATRGKWLGIFQW
ncbi:MAG: ImmA/IrrE family metallo-endopeptidase [Proteobacteria bacterium]|nr:ImmA/IrrE family metallo-endopeptidase [Pseudomonadota bacterium]